LSSNILTLDNALEWKENTTLNLIDYARDRTIAHRRKGPKQLNEPRRFVMSTAARGQTTTFDVAIAGAGGAGLTAALTLAEGGARIILFEKMRHAGGSTRFPEGMFAADSSMQHRRNIRVTRDEAFKSIMEYSHWRANPALVRAFVNRSGETIDWLQQLGVEFIEPSSFWPGAPRTWHLFKGYGAAMIKVLLAHAKGRGIEIRYQTAVKRLLRDANGPVHGVVVEDRTGRQTKLGAKAVIIATGGYANNREWLKKYTGLDLRVNLFPLGNVEKLGEGIRMAWEIGAAEEGMGVLNFSFGGPVGPGIKPFGHVLAAVRQPELWINQHGVRFCDESIVHNSIHAGNAFSRQKGGYSFRIFDEDTSRYFAEKGIDVGVGTFVPPGTKLTGLDAEIKAALEKQNWNVFVADTVDELADKLGVNRAVFKNTVEDYNRFCDKGHDDQFAKEPMYLRPVRHPRFYAFKCYIDFTGTNGGIKINEKTEVLTEEDDVIPGLYATGNDAGGLYGDSYDMIAAGAAAGFAVNSGRMAGENALQYIRRQKP
jgi:fumarate reductase flavoprotein subunit